MYSRSLGREALELDLLLEDVLEEEAGEYRVETNRNDSLGLIEAVRVDLVRRNARAGDRSAQAELLHVHLELFVGRSGRQAHHGALASVRKHESSEGKKSEKTPLELNLPEGRAKRSVVVNEVRHYSDRLRPRPHGDWTHRHALGEAEPLRDTKASLRGG